MAIQRRYGEWPTKTVREKYVFHIRLCWETGECWKKVYDWVKGVKNFEIFWMNNKAILLNSAIIDYYFRIPFHL